MAGRFGNAASLGLPMVRKATNLTEADRRFSGGGTVSSVNGSAMLIHEQYHLAILKEAVMRTRGGEETLGWQTHRGMLGVLLSDAGLDGTGRAPDDARFC